MSAKVMGLVWDHYPVGGAELLVALKLADHADHDGGRIWPSVRRTAELTQQSERSVQRALQAMQKKGWLIVVEKGGHGAGDTTRYRIPVEAIPQSVVARVTKCHPSDGRVTSTTDKGDIHDNQGDTAMSPESSVEATVIEPSLFANANGAWSEFWKAYPRKTAKQTALKAWRKVKGTEIPAVMAALEAHKTSEQWLRGVIPHPATWLHQRRWEDETVSTLDDLGQCMWNRDGSRDPDKPRCTGRGVEDDRGVIYCTKHQHLHRRH